MSDADQKRPVVLTPFAAHARYFEDLSVRLSDNSFAVKPGVIGTIYFAGGSSPTDEKGCWPASTASMSCSART